MYDFGGLLFSEITVASTGDIEPFVGFCTALKAFRCIPVKYFLRRSATKHSFLVYILRSPLFTAHDEYVKSSNEIIVNAFLKHNSVTKSSIFYNVPSTFKTNIFKVKKIGHFYSRSPESRKVVGPVQHYEGQNRTALSRISSTISCPVSISSLTFITSLA